MSKQVLIKGIWYDVLYIKQDGDRNRFLIVYQFEGSPYSFYANSQTIRDKPVDESVDWDKPLQIKCGEWHDVIFHKRYGDTVSLIFENKAGEPVYVNENMDGVSIRDITIRNKPPTIKFEKWIVYSKDGINNICGSSITADKLVLQDRRFKIKHIKVEWEL